MNIIKSEIAFYKNDLRNPAFFTFSFWIQEAIFLRSRVLIIRFWLFLQPFSLPFGHVFPDYLNFLSNFIF